jgi:signal transduction histidine kinase
MPDGGELSIEVVDEHDWVTINISDTGSGIPDDLAEVIDVPFVSGNKKGKGLGVPTAKRIIESHGGEMSYISESGSGTRWDIRLPRASVNL